MYVDYIFGVIISTSSHA